MNKKLYVVLIITVVLIIAFVFIIVFHKLKREENSTLTSSDTLSAALSQITEENAEIVLGGDEDPIIADGLSIGSRPVLLVNGKMFYCTGGAMMLDGADIPNGSVHYSFGSVTYLPKGYTEYGAIKGVTNEEPTEDGQMQTEQATVNGTIYISELTPEAVYVCMTGDLTGEARYVRFISEELDNGYRVKWNGKYYRIRHDRCEILSQVPETCESIGTLDFVGIDKIPEQDLETNCPSDGVRAFEGREAFFDVNEPDYIYVHKTYSGDGVFKCPLWDE